MNKHNTLKEMVSTKTKNKIQICSTPEHLGDSPSRDSDSEAASPVPFLCTQDGADGQTDVVWNFYTPKSENTSTSRVKNSTPLSRKPKRCFRPKTIEKQIQKRRPIKPSQKKTELFQELFELNQNLQELITKTQNSCVPEKPQTGSEEDIFNDNLDCSPKCVPRSNSRCLRKNVLSSNFSKPDPESALESDDSMNECLLKASQMVEENFLKNDSIPAKRPKYENSRSNLKTETNNLDHDSMDAILNNIRLESPLVSKVKQCNSPCLNNDSFDNLVGNLNDSILEQLTQMPIKTDPLTSKSNFKTKDWTINELVTHNVSPSSKPLFGRHNSMPESPSVPDMNKPSTSGMVFGRYNSMPFHNDVDQLTDLGDSPIRCTPDEIKKKHQLAREKLMAKRLLPFTSQQVQTLPTQLTQQVVSKKPHFQPKIASSASTLKNSICNANKPEPRSNAVDLKQLIEKKRQEALMKLRRRQPQNK